MNICIVALFYFKGLSDDNTDLATAVNNISSKSNVKDGCIKSDEILRVKCTRSKYAGSRATISDAMVRGDEQRDKGNDYCDSERVAKRMKFDEEGQKSQQIETVTMRRESMCHRNLS